MSLFHYVTYKYIVIKDKRLGIAYYSLAVLIVLYTFGQIVINKAYLQFDTTPRGNLRILTNSPPLKKQETSFIESEPSLGYCCNSSVVPVSSKIGKKKSMKVQCLTCRKLDGLSLNWPVESKAVTIATLIKERWENTGGNEKDREKFVVQREDAFFTLNPEHVLLKIEHSISALSSSVDPFSASHRMMHGWLLNSQGKQVRRLNDESISKADRIRLVELLQAAGIQSLDEPSDALNAHERTYRENGILLQVIIEYQNCHKSWFGTGVTEYTYRVHRVPYSDYRVKQEVPIIDSARFENGLGKEMSPKKRLVSKRYCTRVEFTQAGKIGQFSTSNMIIQLISGMGLLTLTATVIDIIALYIVPMRTMYRKYVYELSPELQEQINKSHKEISNYQKDTDITEEIQKEPKDVFQDINITEEPHKELKDILYEIETDKKND